MASASMMARRFGLVGAGVFVVAFKRATLVALPGANGSRDGEAKSRNRR
jgi:hypothetical protein